MHKAWECAIQREKVVRSACHTRHARGGSRAGTAAVLERRDDRRAWTATISVSTVDELKPALCSVRID